MQTMFSGVKNELIDEDHRFRTAMNEIRQAMLDHLDDRLHMSVQSRLIHAVDLQDLWYLRGDVMAAIASVSGESVARRKLSHISDMFKGHLPKGLSSRPSPLMMN